MCNNSTFITFITSSVKSATFSQWNKAKFKLSLKIVNMNFVIALNTPWFSITFTLANNAKNPDTKKREMRCRSKYI